MPPPSPSSHKTVLENTAIRFLSFRPRFKAEVENKLLLKAKEINADPTLINQIIESLEKSGYINDNDLIESYIRHRLVERGKGPFWIKMKLLRLGLQKNVIEESLREHAGRNVQLEVIRNIIQKNNIKKSDLSKKARLVHRLLGRGFGLPIINQAFDVSSAWE